MKVHLGNSLRTLTAIESNTCDLIICSPPYVQKRKGTYGGISEHSYVTWLMEISKQIKRILKPTGTFILNIKEGAKGGARQTYVYEWVLAMVNDGWIWTEEWMWRKTNSFPGKWCNRLRDGYERIYQFNKAKGFRMYQKEVMKPIGDWADNIKKSKGYNEDKRVKTVTGSGFEVNYSNWLNKDKVLPDNVVTFGTARKKNHPAAFPEELPEFFIKLFTKKGDLVLDPFAGSGTTLFVAERLERDSIGIDQIKVYVNEIKKQIPKKQVYHRNTDKRKKILNKKIEGKGKYLARKKSVKRNE